MDSKALSRRYRAQFFEMLEEFAEQLIAVFPECEDTKELLTMYRGTVKSSAAREDEMLQSWIDNMKCPLNPKHVKYAKAIERILGQNGCVYHACMYRDVESMYACCDSPTLNKMKLYEKFYDERMDSTSKEISWKYIDIMNEAAHKSMGVELPRVPTRDEINASIAKKKAPTPSVNSEQPSMVSAFYTNIKELASAMQQSSVYANLNGEEQRTMMQTWAKTSRVEIDGKKASAWCENKDPRGLEPFKAQFEDLSFETVSDEAWMYINQLNTFSAVGDNIPSKMMGRIEDLANKLADDLVSGNKDLSQLNLSDIGQQVLAGCDPADMSKFAENIGDILPALQGFQKQHMGN
jgi:hypothetical protein